MHKQGVLIPAIRLYIGANDYRKIYATFDGGKTEWRFVYPKDVKKFKPEKIDKKKYYHVSTIVMSGKDWLNWYDDRNMVKYPWEEKFKPWPKPLVYNFTPNLKEVDEAQELFYEKYQMLWLKEILQTRKFYRLPGGTSEAHVAKILKPEAERFYGFMDFYIQVEYFLEQWTKIKSEKWQGFLKQYKGDKKEAMLEWQGHFKADYSRQLDTKAQKILTDSHLTIDEIKDWQYWLARKTLFGQSHYSSAITNNYLKGMGDSVLAQAEDANYIIFVLNQFIDLVSKEQITIRQVMGDTRHRCAICHKPYEPVRQHQFTCGDPDCKAAYKNLIKRQNRKSGKYKPR